MGWTEQEYAAHLQKERARNLPTGRAARPLAGPSSANRESPVGFSQDPPRPCCGAEYGKSCKPFCYTQNGHEGLDALASTPDSENFCPACNKAGVIAEPQGYHHRCGTPVIMVGEARKKCGFKIILHGQIKGAGKNNMGRGKNGGSYAKPNFQNWRDGAVIEAKAQLPRGFKTITEPVNVRLTYVAEDRTRRDCPAVLDGIWHVLERASVVADDTLLWPAESSRSYDKNNPRCEIEFL